MRRTMSATELLNAVIKVPIEAQRGLIQTISESVETEDGFDPKVSLSGDALATLEQRIDDQNSGAVNPVDAMEALARARSRIQASRRS